MDAHGAQKIMDTMIHDGFMDPYNNIHIGNCAELCCKKNLIFQDKTRSVCERKLFKSAKSYGKWVV